MFTYTELYLEWLQCKCLKIKCLAMNALQSVLRGTKLREILLKSWFSFFTFVPCFSFGLPSGSFAGCILLAQLGLRKPIQKKGFHYAWAHTLAHHWFSASYGKLQKISFWSVYQAKRGLWEYLFSQSVGSLNILMFYCRFMDQYFKWGLDHPTA